MLIQHILTEEIFLSIFSDTQLLEENNIARELRQVEATFFTGQTKHHTLDQIKHYYECIKAHATSIVSHREKQTFLKVIYENFYKAYNPKGADRLGIVYTPARSFDFMIRTHRHAAPPALRARPGRQRRGNPRPRHRHRHLHLRHH